MSITWTEQSRKSNGGTELMCRELEKRVDHELLKEFQIFPSRVKEDLDPTKLRILWLHDTANDPETEHLANDGWKRFHRLVFVSHHQKAGFQAKYNIPASKCVVMLNAIEPLQKHKKPPIDKINLIYTSTPQRGLNILYAVFNELCKKHDDLWLDVYSSFDLYGWNENNTPFQALFDQLNEHPKIGYHGSVPNEELRSALMNAHIFAYPSTWPETSCLCLMEAMSADLICVHSDLGALYETAANWTLMYNYHEDLSKHAGVFMSAMEAAIDTVRTEQINSSQKSYVDVFYNWESRAQQWTAFLGSLLGEDRSIPSTEPEFTYRIG